MDLARLTHLLALKVKKENFYVKECSFNYKSEKESRL